VKPIVNRSTPTNPENRCGLRGERGDEHHVGGDHHTDTGQQNWATPQPVHEDERAEHRGQRSGLHDRWKDKQGEVAVEAHCLEQSGTVKDNRVDAGDLDGKTQRDHEDSGAQVWLAQHLHSPTAAFVPQRAADLGEFTLYITVVRLQLPQHLPGLSDPALE